MIFGFDHMSTDLGPGGIWDPVDFRYDEFFDILTRQNHMERLMANSVYVENHDQARFISRICEDQSLLMKVPV